MVIWKERTHDNDDAFAERNVGCIATLWDYRLLKFFRTPIMVSHEQLLEHILWMWNPKQQHFEVGAHILTVEVEDIYFLNGLSRQGGPHLTNKFPWKGYYHSRACGSSLCSRDEDIGE